MKKEKIFAIIWCLCLLTGRVLGQLIEPARIDLPLESPDTTKILGVACGRAHTIIHTDEGGKVIYIHFSQIILIM